MPACMLEEAIGFLGSADLPQWPGREADLTALTVARERLAQRYRVAVVGEFSSGKSFLLNALLGKAQREEGSDRLGGLLAVDINPSTATITELEYSAEESAVARYPSGREERIPLERLSRFVAVGKEDEGRLHDATADVTEIDPNAPAHVLVRVDSPFLARGFVIADTPGLASLNPAHRRATLAYLPLADAVLYLIDTQQPFTEGDASFLGLVGEYVRVIFVVQTKIDLRRQSVYQNREGDPLQAWENARGRILARAAQVAPMAEVFAVSAREYAIGQLDDDEALRERSGFPALLDALERTLEERVQCARVEGATSLASFFIERAAERLAREHTLLDLDEAELHEEQERAERRLDETDLALLAERTRLADASERIRPRIDERGAALGGSLVRTLARAIDVADIEHLRDRGRLHMIVDAAAAQLFGAFAADVATDVTRDLSEITQRRSDLPIIDFAARRLGGSGGSGAWSRDLAAGIRSTIVLGGIGGPTIGFVSALSSAFAARPMESYMKRELGADLRARFLPELESAVAGFTLQISREITGLYADLCSEIDNERRSGRTEALEPIDRAKHILNDEPARTAVRERIAAAEREARALLGRLQSELPVSPDAAGRDATQAQSDDGAEFDAQAYQSGLRPERLRVVILGGLDRGKSSLINAIAGTRLLQDEGETEARFPIHVRFGAERRAYALEGEGRWHEVPVDAAMVQAGRTPVLIEVPWAMPRQLVLVHAPAFDSGEPQAERIALAAVTAASEVLMLFSRQLSEGEIGLLQRIKTLRRPLLLAHTLADLESSNERRTVVELAQRYLDEHRIEAHRIFTISALDFTEASLAGRAPAPWNELGALRDTLSTHAEEHMDRLARREREAAALKDIAARPSEAGKPSLRTALGRFFGRSER